MWPNTDKIPLASVRFAPVKVQGIDENHQLYGNFIGVQFVFDQLLDATVLAESIDHLILQHPELAGQYDREEHQVVPSDDHVWLRLLPNYAGHARDHAKVGTSPRRRHEFIYEPSRRDVQSGQAILSSFMLTSFERGGCIFSMAISHVLVDAAGFHMLAQYLGEIYSSKIRGENLPKSTLISDLNVFRFGTARSARETFKGLKKASLAKPLKLKGLFGRFIRGMITKSLDNMGENNRVIFLLTAEDVARLKQTVLRESGENWISTNIALSAHFASVMAEFMFPNEPVERVQMAQLLDLRKGHFLDSVELQSKFTRNAILIDTELAEFDQGVQTVSRGELARFFKGMLSKVDGPYLKDRLDLIADCLRYGYSYPGLDFKTSTIAFNNQSKMDVYAVQFGGQSPLRVIPQDVGDNVMFFPIPGGGVEVYLRDILNPERQEELTSDAWQRRIFDF